MISLNDNNSESIFAVQATVKSGSGNNANGDLQLNFIQEQFFDEYCEYCPIPVKKGSN